MPNNYRIDLMKLRFCFIFNGFKLNERFINIAEKVLRVLLPWSKVHSHPSAKQKGNVRKIQTITGETVWMNCFTLIKVRLKKLWNFQHNLKASEGA